MTLVTALMSCTFLGLQHGIDWDHVAAISDVTSVQRSSAEATRCGLLYAAGHAATVGVLGIAVMTLRHTLPAALSVWMQRIVGLTLVMLGAYVIGVLFSGHGPVSRGQVVLAILDRFHVVHRNAEVGSAYGRKSSLGLGVLHGLGAETPTQLSMLVIATNLGGLLNGVLALVVFAAAMFASNMALTATATSAFAISKLRPSVFRWVGAATAGYSLFIGAVLMRSS